MPSLVLLVGPSGCGKSTFAARHFARTEIVSSDHCRELVCDDAANQEATTGAFVVLHTIVEQRLAFGRLTVVDATNLRDFARAPLLALAEQWRRPAIAIVLDLPAELCLERAAARAVRPVERSVVERQIEELALARAALHDEPLDDVVVLRGARAVEEARVRRVPQPALPPIEPGW